MMVKRMTKKRNHLPLQRKPVIENINRFIISIYFTSKSGIVV